MWLNRAHVVRRACGWGRFLGAVFAASLAGGATAQETFLGQHNEAKSLIQVGAYAAARDLLAQRLEEAPADVEALFLLGMIATAEGNSRRAVTHFRRALVHAPDAIRIRLELARAFFDLRDFENAYRQFQFARAGNPPAGVVETIDRYLQAIRREKDWSYSFGVALAPDSNINNATSAREAVLLGLPFELSDDSRRQSGIGVAIDSGLEVAPKIASAVRLRLGAGAQRREYSGSEFDDMILAFHTGPRWVVGRWDVSLLGTGFRRWFGGRRLTDAIGITAEATFYPGARTAISFGLSALDLRYPNSPLQSGLNFAIQAGGGRALTPTSRMSARVRAGRQDARAGDFSNWSGLVSLNYYRDLPGGFSISVEPTYAFARYDSADPFFGFRRRDAVQELQVAVLHRRIVLSRFTPRLSYTLARRQSNIELYEYVQNRLEIGLTTNF